jgi:hypothetical protein
MTKMEGKQAKERDERRSKGSKERIKETNK